jgi:hypothetical protein
MPAPARTSSMYSLSCSRGCGLDVLTESQIDAIERDHDPLDRAPHRLVCRRIQARNLLLVYLQSRINRGDERRWKNRQRVRLIWRQRSGRRPPPPAPPSAAATNGSTVRSWRQAGRLRGHLDAHTPPGRTRCATPFRPAALVQTLRCPARHRRTAPREADSSASRAISTARTVRHHPRAGPRISVTLGSDRPAADARAAMVVSSAAQGRVRRS